MQLVKWWSLQLEIRWLQNLGAESFPGKNKIKRRSLHRCKEGYCSDVKVRIIFVSSTWPSIIFWIRYQIFSKYFSRNFLTTNQNSCSYYRWVLNFSSHAIELLFFLERGCSKKRNNFLMFLKIFSKSQSSNKRISCLIRERNNTDLQPHFEHKKIKNWSLQYWFQFCKDHVFAKLKVFKTKIVENVLNPNLKSVNFLADCRLFHWQKLFLDFFSQLRPFFDRKNWKSTHCIVALSRGILFVLFSGNMRKAWPTKSIAGRAYFGLKSFKGFLFNFDTATLRKHLNIEFGKFDFRKSQPTTQITIKITIYTWD